MPSSIAWCETCQPSWARASTSSWRARVFGINGGIPAIEQVVITELGDKRVGFVVDKVIGQHQTVIKTMGHMLKNIDNISGATILGDGTVALILDVYKLIQQTEYLEQGGLQ